MIRQPTQTLADLYEADETAWLDAMAEMIVEGRHEDLDFTHLSEFLTDMARSDRRRVESRLLVLIMHVLKWVHQPDKRSSSWRRTINLQRRELARLIKTATLRKHAEASLAEAYEDAVELAADETELPETTFPAECPWTLEQLMSPDVLADDSEATR